MSGNGRSSVVVVWREAIIKADVPPLTKLVGFVLAENMNAESGIAWPSKKYLAERCGLSERSVFTKLRQLRAAGLLVIESSRGRKRTTYRIPSTVHQLLHGSNRATVQDAVANRATGGSNRAPAVAHELVELVEHRGSAAAFGGGDAAEDACDICGKPGATFDPLDEIARCPECQRRRCDDCQERGVVVMGSLRPDATSFLCSVCASHYIGAAA